MKTIIKLSLAIFFVSSFKINAQNFPNLFVGVPVNTVVGGGGFTLIGSCQAGSDFHTITALNSSLVPVASGVQLVLKITSISFPSVPITPQLFCAQSPTIAVVGSTYTFAAASPSFVFSCGGFGPTQVSYDIMLIGTPTVQNEIYKCGYNVALTLGNCQNSSILNTNSISNCTVNQCPSSPNLTVTANGTTTFCQGGSVILASSTSTSYLWSNGATTQSVSVSAPGNYFVSTSNLPGCPNSNMITVNVNVLPTIIANSNMFMTTLCPGQSATLTASGANTYTWNNGVTSTTNIVSPTVTTSYTVTGTDANGCSNTAVVSQSASTCNGFVTLSGVEAHQILIYPNPTSGFLNLDLGFLNEVSSASAANVQVQILNVFGEVVLDKSAVTDKNLTLNINNFNGGIYFVQVKENDRFIKSVKLVKE